MVDRLKDELVDFEGSVRLERQTHHLEGVSQTLDTNADRTMLHV